MSKNRSVRKTVDKVVGGKNLTATIREGVVRILSAKGGDSNKDKVNAWTGTMTQLDRALRRVIAMRTVEKWPASPSAMRLAINNAVSSLRRSGVRVEFSRTPDHMRRRIVEFVRR